MHSHDSYGTRQLQYKHNRLLSLKPSIVAACAIAFSVLILAGTTPQALSRDFDQAKVQSVATKIKNDPVSLGRVSVGTMWNIEDWLAVGPGLSASYSDDHIDLYDRYRDISLSFETMVSYRYGIIRPYARLGIILGSYFRATGNVLAQKPNTTTAAQESHHFDYHLEGQMKGSEQAIGTMVNLTENLSLLWEFSILRQTMSISRTKVDTGFDTKDVPLDIEGRRGILLQRSNEQSPYEVIADQKRITTVGRAMAMGIVYRL